MEPQAQSMARARGTGLRRLAGSARRELSARMERLLHPLRRWRARSRLTDGDGWDTIVFVCHGNICRSPYAASVLERLLVESGGATAKVRSAGRLDAGRPCPAAGVRVAAARGVDLGAHRSVRLLALDDLPRRSLVVVMDGEQRRWVVRWFGHAAADVLVLGDLDPERPGRRGVPDPWQLGEAAFEASYARIDRCVAELAARLPRPPAERVNRRGTARTAAGRGAP